MSDSNPNTEQNSPKVANVAKVNAEDAMRWLSDGFKAFQYSPLMWVVLSIIFIVISLGINSLPFAHYISTIYFPFVSAGLMLGCRAQANGEKLKVAHLFSGINNQGLKILALGLVMIVYSYLVYAFVELMFSSTLEEMLVTVPTLNSIEEVQRVLLV
jgi:hypothetical protein